MNNRINEIQDEIIDEFSGFSDWMDKYSYIIEMGNALPPIDERHKTPDNIIEGCQSRVWLNAEYRDGKIHFAADSDAIIVKGRHPRCKPLLHRQHRADRAPVADAQQRASRHGEADKDVCARL